ncbi:RNA-directed DNA polymerase, eukaryota [Tanacetum coccineum]
MIRTKINVKGKFIDRIRELNHGLLELDDEFCESSSDDEFVGDEKNNSITGDANDHVSESSFMNENIENVINEQEPPQDKISEDPFGIYNILNKQDNKEAGQDSDPSHPPGFTQEVNVGVSVNLPVHSDISPNIGGSQNVSGVNRSFSLKTGGINYGYISEKKSLWEYITHIIDTWDGECIILGDFNEVRSKQERFGTIFNETAANVFNHFISTAGLIDLPLEGYSFTWAIKSAKKMSKLDRFLISEGLLLKFPSLSAICLDRHLSDHRPIIMREVVYWIWVQPFSCQSNLFTRSSIKEWCKDDIKRSNDTCFSIKARLSDLDKLFDNGLSNEELVTERISLLKELHNFNKSHSLDLAQKAKVRWAIEGDENSKYFHGIINKKRSQLAIRGVLIDGDWIDEPCKWMPHPLNRPFADLYANDLTFVSHRSFPRLYAMELRNKKGLRMRELIDSSVVNASIVETHTWKGLKKAASPSSMITCWSISLSPSNDRWAMAS